MLAARLGVPVQRLQRETTSTEFNEWMAFLEQDFDIPKREDFFLAQIAAEVRRTIAKDPKAVKLDHFMLHFAAPAGHTATGNITEAERQRNAAASKARWLALVGIRQEGVA